MLIIEKCANTRAVTIFVRGSNKMVRWAFVLIHRFLNRFRLLMKPKEHCMMQFVPLGILWWITVSCMVGAQPTSVVRWLFQKLPTKYAALSAFKPILMRCQIPSIEQYAMRAFSSALDAVPLALAENSGLSPIETLTEVKSRQLNEGDSTLGIDCNGRGENGADSLSEKLLVLNNMADMKKQFVYDPLISKRQQYLLATQVYGHIHGMHVYSNFAACTCCA